MKFSFPLQKILDLKTQMEEQAKIELTTLENERKILQKSLKKLEMNLLEISEKITSKKETTPSEISLFSEYREYLLQELEIKKNNLRLKEKEIEEKKQQVLELIKERKILQKLKEKAFLKFLEEEKKTEQKEIDEHAIHKKETL